MSRLSTPVEVTIDLSSDAEHTIGLRLDGYDDEGAVFGVETLTESQLSARELNFPMTSSIPPGLLSIDSPSYPVVVTVTPRGGGSAQTSDSSGNHQITLSPGRYVVELSAPSVFWVSADRPPITVASEQVVTIRVPPVVGVRVVANPGNCVVSIDGVVVGPQPFDIQLVTGRHTFTFDWTGISQGLRHMPFTVGIDTRQIFGVPER